ncbi:MAG: hypothetical protein R2755_31750 [Acidimicrobiales bacterium]
MNQRSMPSPCAERVAATVDRSGSLTVAPLLDAIAAQAEKADLSRSVDPDVITALKASPVLPMVASTEIGRSEASVARLGAELAAVAAACGSTAWCLWNHWSVFHLFVGALGPDHADLLRAMVEGHQWVCFPGGAGSQVFGRIDGDEVVLDGSAMFGSGSRYADWTGVAFAIGDGSRPPTPTSCASPWCRSTGRGCASSPRGTVPRCGRRPPTRSTTTACASRWPAARRGSPPTGRPRSRTRRCRWSTAATGRIGWV